MTRWQQMRASVASLQLDSRNPRLSRDSHLQTPRELIRYLFEHDKALDVAESIATRGFFENEPLLVVRENTQLVVVEGNRRLAALKALRDPSILEGKHSKRIAQLSNRIEDLSTIASVPIVIAPSRKATDLLVAGRHIGTPVLPWQAENRAKYILDRIEQGYSTWELTDRLGFTPAQIQDARLTKAIADVARSLPLSEGVRKKLSKPKTTVLSTLKRIITSSSGREFLGVNPDAEFGFVGRIRKDEFGKAFAKIVNDIATGDQTSRTLNTNADIDRYFANWTSEEVPDKTKKGTFIPRDFTGADAKKEDVVSKSAGPKTKVKGDCKTVLPKDLKVFSSAPRLHDVRGELVKLKREKYPNAGAMLLRAFFELAAVDFLTRRGELEKIESKLKQNKSYVGPPKLKDLVPSLIRIAKSELKTSEANNVEKAITYNSAAPFTLSDLHSFVHDPASIPGGHDIRQFWLRTEPLFRLMLQADKQ